MELPSTEAIVSALNDWYKKHKERERLEEKLKRAAKGRLEGKSKLRKTAVEAIKSGKPYPALQYAQLRLALDVLEAPDFETIWDHAMTIDRGRSLGAVKIDKFRDEDGDILADQYLVTDKAADKKISSGIRNIPSPEFLAANKNVLGCYRTFLGLVRLPKKVGKDGQGRSNWTLSWGQQAVYVIDGAIKLRIVDADSEPIVLTKDQSALFYSSIDHEATHAGDGENENGDAVFIVARNLHEIETLRSLNLDEGE